MLFDSQAFRSYLCLKFEFMFDIILSRAVVFEQSCKMQMGEKEILDIVSFSVCLLAGRVKKCYFIRGLGILYS